MTSLTEAQKEAAARELCRSMKIIPGDRISFDGVLYHDGLDWARSKIAEHESILLAIEHGRSAE